LLRTLLKNGSCHNCYGSTMSLYISNKTHLAASHA
jgi:hypothetical protein